MSSEGVEEATEVQADDSSSDEQAEQADVLQGSCSSLIEALAAASAAKHSTSTDGDASVADDGKSERRSDNGKGDRRRSSVFNIFHKGTTATAAAAVPAVVTAVTTTESDRDNEIAAAENADVDHSASANGKLKLRQTQSLNPTSNSSNATTSSANNSQPVSHNDLNRAFRSETDLMTNHAPPRPPPPRPPPPLTVQISSDPLNEDIGDGHHLQPPASAPPVPSKSRRDSLAFVRKMSKKIRHSVARESISDAGNNSSDDAADTDKSTAWLSMGTRKNDKLLCVKPPRFEVIDLSAEDVAHTPPIRKMCYPQLLAKGMSHGLYALRDQSSISITLSLCFCRFN